MSQLIDLPAAERPPELGTFIASHGMLSKRPVPPRVLELIEHSFSLYAELSNARGVWHELAQDEFIEVYRGEGRNEPRTPLERVAGQAERLALFAVTLGQALSSRVERLFAGEEPALAYLLDAVASERADHAATLLAARYAEGLPQEASHVLPYSPGYCGWHITGQRRLFERLRPERIGITLNASCLMQPLKSVSGVFAGGPAEIHVFEDDFEFCEACRTRACRLRIEGLGGGAP